MLVMDTEIKKSLTDIVRRETDYILLKLQNMTSAQ